MIQLLSILIRNFLLPNPFECFGEKALVINHVVGGVIGLISYSIVSLDYKRGSNPSKGSFRYLFVFTIITLLLYVMGLFSFAWWSVLGVLIAFVGVMYGLVRLNEHIADREDWRDY